MSLDSILRATGKNLLPNPNVHAYNYSLDYKKYNNTDEIFLTAGTYSVSVSANCPTLQFWNVTTKQQYTVDEAVSAYSTNTYYKVYEGYALGRASDAVRQMWFTLKINALITLNSANTSATSQECQIEKGSTATTYEPYEYLGPKTIKIGGNSKNLIQYPYTETTKTQKGITFTDNGDGTITVNGTSTGLATFTLGSVSLDRTKSYFLYGKNTSSNLVLRIQMGQVWRAEAGNGLAISQVGGKNFSITLSALKGFTFNNVIIYPQLEEGSVATDYKVNTGDKEVLKVKYNSKNLIPYPYVSNTITNNGVTYTVNANGSIKVSGTASADNNSTFFIRSNTLPLTLKQGEQYTLSGYIEGSGVTFSMQDSSFKQIISVNNTATSKSFTTLYSNYYMWLVVLKGTTVDTVVYPQLEMGNKATDYVPYFNTTVWTKKA